MAESALKGRGNWSIDHLTMEKHGQTYVPALGFDWLTPLYDPILRLTLRERTLKRRLIEQARIEPGHAVLDLGCGTGTLLIMIKRACPAARVVGLDGDPKVLEIARRKIAAAGVDVELHEGMAYDPPLPPASFDRVLTSLVLHHLSTDEKRRTLAAMRRLLRPGGQLHIADFGKPQNMLMWLISTGFRFFDGSERTGANLDGRLPSLVEEAGYQSVAETERHMTLFGTLAFVRAEAPT